MKQVDNISKVDKNKIVSNIFFIIGVKTLFYTNTFYKVNYDSQSLQIS